MAEIIERPCTSCGISVEKGVKIVAVVDVLSGCACLSLWSFVLSLVLENPPEPYVPPDPYQEDFDDDNHVEVYQIQHEIHESEMEQSYYNLGVGILITLVVFSVIQVMFGFLLYYGQAKKSIPLLNTWLVVSGFSIPANGLLIKIYEMIVVFTFTDELKCEERAGALEKFKELPYICVMETQWYPDPGGWEWFQDKDKNKDDGDSQNSSAAGRKYGISTFYQSKSFLINGPTDSLFSEVHHNHHRMCN